MKIKDVKVYVLSSQLNESFAFSQGWVNHRSAVVVEVVTENGINGWGESMCHGLQSPHIAAATINSVLKPLIIGEDALEVEVLWDKMYNRTRAYGQKGAVIGAISAIDIALYDVIGKALNQPIYNLLGGAFRKKIMPYATGFYRRKEGNYPADLVEEALEHKSKGFKGMKLKTGFGIDEDIELIWKIREAVGDDIILMVDANQAYNLAQARTIIRKVADADLYWFEEPLPPEDIMGYKELKTNSPVYIAAGENEYTRWGFAPWFEARALDVVQPDIAHCGGFSELKKIATMASAVNIMFNPHVWGTAISLAASLQLLATIPPIPVSLNPVSPMLEYDQSSHPFRRELVTRPLVMIDGMVDVPDGPGLGIEINREVLKKYSAAE